MKTVIAFLKLIRIQNLLLIAGIQYALRYCLFAPIFQKAEIEFQVSDFNFFLLSLSIVMIAAAGNIINDYFDMKIDRINKPNRVIVGQQIKRRVAMGAHVVINILAILIGAYASHKAGNIKWVGFHVIAAGVLWYYATFFKKKLIIGNLIIAFLAALIPLLVPIYEVPLLKATYPDANINFGILSNWALGYAVFGFLFTLTREIIKDVADIQGDKQFDCKTIPIVFGINASVRIVIFIYLLICFTLYYLLTNSFLGDLTTFSYVGLFIALPMFYSIYRLYAYQDKFDFIFLSKINKIMSLMAILYMVLANYMIKNGPIL